MQPKKRLSNNILLLKSVRFRIRHTPFFALLNAYYKETEKPFGYLLVDNKPGTSADQ